MTQSSMPRPTCPVCSQTVYDLVDHLTKYHCTKVSETTSQTQMANGQYYNFQPNNQNQFNSTQNYQSNYNPSQFCQNNNFNPSQNSQNVFNASQNSQNSFNSSQNRQNFFNASQNSQNCFNASQNSQNCFNASQNSQNCFNSSQNSQYSFNSSHNIRSEHPNYSQPYNNFSPFGLYYDVPYQSSQPSYNKYCHVISHPQQKIYEYSGHSNLSQGFPLNEAKPKVSDDVILEKIAANLLNKFDFSINTDQEDNCNNNQSSESPEHVTSNAQEAQSGLQVCTTSQASFDKGDSNHESQQHEIQENQNFWSFEKSNSIDKNESSTATSKLDASNSTTEKLTTSNPISVDKGDNVTDSNPGNSIDLELAISKQDETQSNSNQECKSTLSDNHQNEDVNYPFPAQSDDDDHF